MDGASAYGRQVAGGWPVSRVPHDRPMNAWKVGRSLRAIRRSRGLRQVDVATEAGVSQALVSSIERGRCGTVAVSTLDRVVSAAGADLECLVRYRSAELDRLLDEAHAATTIAALARLRAAGWSALTVVSFNHYGDRGSVDILALHPTTRTVLVVEVKSEIASAEEMLRRLDVKARLGGRLALDRFGERPARVARLLVVRDSTVNRARVRRLEPLLAAALPLRSGELRRWLAAPGPMVGGLLFVDAARDTSGGAGTRGARRVRRSAGAERDQVEHDRAINAPSERPAGARNDAYQRPG
jgi:transcriptional regulator with XRE-family HTH domain